MERNSSYWAWVSQVLFLYPWTSVPSETNNLNQKCVISLPTERVDVLDEVKEAMDHQRSSETSNGRQQSMNLLERCFEPLLKFK